jgi:prepilin-type processing-associated H-X9-DG protein
MSPVDEPGGGESEQPAAGRRFLHTRWEVLVIAVVVAVLLTLLLPAIQHAREASRRAYCTNNLKQIGLAIHNYTQAQRVYPPGTICTTKAKMPGQYDVWGEAAQSGPGFQGTGFLLRVRPYAEADGDITETRWNWRVGISNTNTNLAPYGPHCNLDIAIRDIPGFYCPSRRHGLRAQDHAMMLSASWTGGGTDYGGCAGRHAAFTPQTGYNLCDSTTYYEPNFWPKLKQGSAEVDVDHPPKHWRAGGRQGIFGTVNESMTFGAIRDGLSNTIMTGELQRVTDVNPGSKDGWAIGGPATLFTTGALFSQRDTTSVPAASPNEGRLLNNGFFGSPGSDHPGGTNIGLADGSVSFVPDAVDPNIFALLGCVSTGQPPCLPED